MDPEYYDRQAAAQLKKVESETTKRATAEKKAAELDGKALRADSAATSSRSETTRRSKLHEAESARRSAVDQRAKVAAATKAAGDAQKKANDFRAKAEAERARRTKKTMQEAERHRREAERRARREAQDQATRHAGVRRDIGELNTRAVEIEQRIAASLAQAPKQITVLLMAGTPEGGEEALRLDRRLVGDGVRRFRYRDGALDRRRDCQGMGGPVLRLAGRWSNNRTRISPGRRTRDSTGRKLGAARSATVARTSRR